jgi:hypothetical protein
MPQIYDDSSRVTSPIKLTSEYVGENVARKKSILFAT